MALRRRKITLEAYQIIAEHNADLIAGMEGSLQQYADIPKAKQPEFVRGQIAYWKNAISALKWSTRLAAQRAGVKQDAGCKSV